MRVAYADPPYPGQSKKHYGDHEDYAGEVNHFDLIGRLETEFDGWVLHTSVPALYEIQHILARFDLLTRRDGTAGDYRVLAWVKPFATFKKNVSPAYAWEPVIVRGGRHAEPNRIDGMVMRDWLSENIVLNKGEFAGAKPERLCWWIFECMGLEPDDELLDLFPGTGAVSRAWITWISQLQLKAA